MSEQQQPKKKIPKLSKKNRTPRPGSLAAALHWHRFAQPDPIDQAAEDDQPAQAQQNQSG